MNVGINYRLDRRNLALCLQVEMISALEFSALEGSASAMTIFSVRQRSQRLVPHR